MFCSKCGKQNPDGAAFCDGCGNQLNAAPAAPQQPVYQQPPVAPQQPAPGYYQQPARPAAPGGNPLKQYLHFILGGLAVLAFLIGLLTMFGVFDVNMTASASASVFGQNIDESKTDYASLSEATEALEDLDKSAFTLIAGNILCGLLFLVAAAIGVLYFLKINNNMPYYDHPVVQKLLAGQLAGRPALAMGATGALGALLQVLLYHPP